MFREGRYENLISVLKNKQGKSKGEREERAIWIEDRIGEGLHAVKDIRKVTDKTGQRGAGKWWEVRPVTGIQQVITGVELLFSGTP